jgi:hypothetical protein
MLGRNNSPVLAFRRIVRQEVRDDICDFLLGERVEVEVCRDAPVCELSALTVRPLMGKGEEDGAHPDP